MIGGMMFLGYMLIQNMGSVMAMLPGGGGEQTIQVIGDNDSEDYEDYVDQLDCNEDGSRCKWCDDLPDPEDCNEVIEVCGSAVESKDDSESRVARRAQKKWEIKSEKYHKRCNMKGNINSTVIPALDNFVVPGSGNTGGAKELKSDPDDPRNFVEKFNDKYGYQPGKSTSKPKTTSKPKPPRSTCKITQKHCAIANRGKICKLANSHTAGCRCMCKPGPPRASLGLTLFKHSFHPSNIPRAYITNASRSGMNLHLNYV